MSSQKRSASAVLSGATRAAVLAISGLAALASAACGVTSERPALTPSPRSSTTSSPTVLGKPSSSPSSPPASASTGLHQTPAPAATPRAAPQTSQPPAPTAVATPFTISSLQWRIAYPSGCTSSAPNVTVTVTTTWSSAGRFDGSLALDVWLAPTTSGYWPGGNYEERLNWVSPGVTTAAPGQTQTVSIPPNSATATIAVPGSVFLPPGSPASSPAAFNATLSYVSHPDQRVQGLNINGTALTCT